MSSVYLDPSTILLATSDVVDGRRAIPGATDALRNLREVVDDVVVLTSGSLEGIDLPSGVRVAASLPDPVAAGTWFLTADPESEFGRPPGATTMLVGPKRAPRHLPLPRFDVEARDLPAAVIEILTREAMG